MGKILSAKTVSYHRQMQFLFLVLSFVFVSFPKNTKKHVVSFILYACMVKKVTIQFDGLVFYIKY